MNKEKMMKKYVILLTLSILLMSGVGSATTVDIGKQIFDEKCGFCHGGHPPTNASDAQSIMALAEDAKVREESIGEIVRNGTKDGMPSFSKSEISDIDIKYLADYLKTVPNSFDSLGTTPTASTTPEMTPAGTVQNKQVQKTVPKTSGFELVFVGLGILAVYTIRRNYKK